MSRPLTKREERRYDKQAARRYTHAILFRECRVGFFCWRCLWREHTGYFDRKRADLIARARAVAPTIPARRVTPSQEAYEHAFNRRMTEALSLHGQVLCPTPHHPRWDGEPCGACRAQV